MPSSSPKSDASAQIAALLPGGPGHQFVIYGDACSGQAGTPHEQNFSGINDVIRRLEPSPEFILFAGDEIAGLTASPDELRAQWRHWLDEEMGWLQGRDIPIWHATSNHTTYDRMSEGVFREVLEHLPRNGPPGQEGLSYWVRRDDLLIVFVHTLWTGLGGEGYVETDWLREVLHNHADARHKIVVGHHPVHPINGFRGAYVREVGPECAGPFWDTLVEAGVLAYFCSHILAFDAQVHRGVLQICTAGAGTAHRMPEGIEYLHCVQVALDEAGLRYQVLDIEGRVREQLSWPLTLPTVEKWGRVPLGVSETALPRGHGTIALRFTGVAAGGKSGEAQTLLSAFSPGILAPLWIGLRGANQRLTVTIGPEQQRSPSHWYGPAVAPDEPFDIRVVIDKAMGPGGILCAMGDDAPWSSLTGASAWGAERLLWPRSLGIGHAQHGPEDRAFRGAGLAVSMTAA